ncbi:type 2 isopentenyl-diphosphate Delta-isomerase [Companilactobacillus sp. DQM5]|uniref:type 2 isopentenyl-diphosphate Delta-isomerase n=1 Tax=Companilactobacillus sp. DQM5 TaxID=3463359 RepID=UPI004058845E
MPKQPLQQQRKNEHLFLAEKFYQEKSENGLSDIKFIHDSLPEIELDEINFKTNLFGKKINYPIYINAMTGGSIQSTKINDTLSRLSYDLNIPIAVGSMSSGIRYPEVQDSYKIVRKNNPNGIVIANISAAHNYRDVLQSIDMIDANAVQIHVNTLQELSMNEGDRNFYWLENINEIINKISIPVIIKEVGFGMSQETFLKLKKIGVKNIDLSGSGGTNFIQIENARNHDLDMSFLNDIKLSTAESLIESKKFQNDFTIFASGGVKLPIDALKSLRLGANYVGMSGLVLHQVQKKSYEEAYNYMNNWFKSFNIISCALGARNTKELMKKPIILKDYLYNYNIQRNK